MSNQSDHVMARPELRAYESELPRLLSQHEGQYVVIRGDKLVEYFDDYSAALTWAYQTYGLEPFFVKRVSDNQNIVHYTRDFGPCR